MERAMKLATRLQERGQLTVPKSLRDRAGLHPGDNVFLRYVGPGRIEVIAFPSMTMAEMLDAYREEGELGDYEAEVRAAEAELAEHYR